MREGKCAADLGDIGFSHKEEEDNFRELGDPCQDNTHCASGICKITNRDGGPGSGECTNPRGEPNGHACRNNHGCKSGACAGSKGVNPGHCDQDTSSEIMKRLWDRAKPRSPTQLSAEFKNLAKILEGKGIGLDMEGEQKYSRLYSLLRQKNPDEYDWLGWSSVVG